LGLLAEILHRRDNNYASQIGFLSNTIYEDRLRGVGERAVHTRVVWRVIDGK
jgi:hypothetical protein